MQRVMYPAGLFVLAAAASASSGSPFVASALVKAGDTVLAPGRTVTDVEGASSNSVGGYLFRVSSTDGTTVLGHLWGNAATGAGSVLRSSGGTIAGYMQGYNPQTADPFETGFGIGNLGQLSYSSNLSSGATVSNADSEWLDNTPLAVGGDPSPNVPGQRWAFASAPKIAAETGEAWFVAGLTSAPTGTSSQRRALIRQSTLTPVLFAGQTPTGAPFPVSDISSIMFDWSLSSNGNNYMAQVSLNDNPLVDKLMTLNGAAIDLGTPGSPSLLEAGVTVPVTAGGQFSEAWQTFASCAVNNSGRWAVTAITNNPTHVLVRDGIITAREGDIVDGWQLTGFMLDTRLNNSSDLVFLTNVINGVTVNPAIYFNRRLLVQAGQTVDLSGDGVVEPTSTLTSVSTGSLAISPRQGGAVRVYFSGTVSNNGTPTAVGMVVKVCIADFNNSGTVSVQDIFDFLSAWFSKQPSADFNNSGAVTVQDIFDFLSAWFAKC